MTPKWLGAPRRLSVRRKHQLKPREHLAFNPESHDLLPHPLAIGPAELDQLIKPAGGLKERVRQLEREGGAVAILAGF
jgi:hypothetical protein